MIRRWWPVALLALCLLGGGIWWATRPPGPEVHGAVAARVRNDPPLPAGIEVEVLNGSGVPNLARVVTVQLREAGLDVVYFGNADPSLFPRGPTRVLVRSADTTGLGRILEVVHAGAVVEQVPPGNRWVAFSVILGSEYAATPDSGGTP